MWYRWRLLSPSDSKEIKPDNPKGNQPWIFIGRTNAEAEAPVLWPPDVKSWLTGKDPDDGKDWRQKEKRLTEDVWYHWLKWHELEQTLGDSEGQGRLACCSAQVTVMSLGIPLQTLQSWQRLPRKRRILFFPEVGKWYETSWPDIKPPCREVRSTILTLLPRQFSAHSLQRGSEHLYLPDPFLLYPLNIPQKSQFLLAQGIPLLPIFTKYTYLQGYFISLLSSPVEYKLPQGFFLSKINKSKMTHIIFHPILNRNNISEDLWNTLTDRLIQASEKLLESKVSQPEDQEAGWWL